MRISKVISALPDPLTADTIYVVRTGDGYALHVTDSTGAVAYTMNDLGGGGGSGLYSEMAIIQHRVASGVDGGRADPRYARRTLNYVEHNTITGASLSSNKFTLPAGTYEISGWAVFYRTQESRVYWLNDGGTALARSGLVFANDSTIALNANINGIFTLASSADCDLWYETNSDNSDRDLGYARSGFGEPEIHVSLTIRKLA